MTDQLCPGGCRTVIEPPLLACKRCWYDLPRDLRDGLNINYQAGTDTAGYRHWHTQALQWWRQTEPTTP